MEFAAGDTSKTIEFAIVDEAVIEENELLYVQLSDPVNAKLATAYSPAIVIIIDNDHSAVSFSSATDTVSEARGRLPITLHVSPPPALTTVVSYTLGGTATEGEDYLDPGNGSFTVQPGAASGEILLNIIDDNLVDSGETIILTLTPAPNDAPALYNLGSQPSHTITITDDDTPVNVTLAASDGVSGGNVRENGIGPQGRRTFTITLSKATTGRDTVTVPLTVHGPAVGAEHTFGLEPSSQTGVTLVTDGLHSPQHPAVRFAAGATSATLRLSPIANSVRTQPQFVVEFGEGGRAPSGDGVSIGTLSGGPISGLIIDDESGDIEVPSNWPLLPSGLNVGDEFRLMYMTSQGRDARSNQIGAYDRFIRRVGAQNGHPDIQPYVGFFKTFASTRSRQTSAGASGRAHVGLYTGLDHTGSGGSTEDGSTSNTSAGDPIYWLNGSRIADNTYDFCDGTWDNRWSSGDGNNHLKNEAGQTVTGTAAETRVWTGMWPDCTDNSLNPLSSTRGGGGNVAYGPGTEGESALATRTGGPLVKGTAGEGQQNRLYAMSPVFKVATAAADVNVALAATGGDADGNLAEAGTDPDRTFTATLSRPLTGIETVTVPLTFHGAPPATSTHSP